MGQFRGTESKRDVPAKISTRARPARGDNLQLNYYGAFEKCCHMNVVKTGFFKRVALLTTLLFLVVAMISTLQWKRQRTREPFIAEPGMYRIGWTFVIYVQRCGTQEAKQIKPFFPTAEACEQAVTKWRANFGKQSKEDAKTTEPDRRLEDAVASTKCVTCGIPLN